MNAVSRLAVISLLALAAGCAYDDTHRYHAYRSDYYGNEVVSTSPTYQTYSAPQTYYPPKSEVYHSSRPMYPTARDESVRVYPDRYYSERSTANVNVHVQGLDERDRAIGDRIIDRLRGDPAFDASFSGVDIFVENGHVILRGDVATERQRHDIEEAVERAAGVNVKNHIRVHH